MPVKNFMKTITVFSLLIVFIMSVTASATSANMIKVAVASDRQTATSVVGGTAARSLYFLIFDGSGKFIEAISNPHKNARSGASPLVVNLMTQQRVNVIISQAFGEKMVGSLKAKGITHFKFKGSADDAVKKYLNLIASK